MVLLTSPPLIVWFFIDSLVKITAHGNPIFRGGSVTETAPKNRNVSRGSLLNKTAPKIDF
jgi:hypothetical protein